MAHEWTVEDADAALAESGAIVNIGQIGRTLARALDKRVKAGDLTKYRGFWNTLSPHWGIGPLKTIWARATES